MALYNVNEEIDNSSPKTLLREEDNGICLLTLNRPKAHNSLNLELLNELQRELSEISTNKSIDVLIIGANGNSFCSGHDLKELRSNESEKIIPLIFNLCCEIMQLIIELPQPVIAQVQGTATAAGCQLVASCDLAISAKSAEFITPGVNIGLFCSTPMVALSRNIPRKVVMEMLMTGEPMDSHNAEKWGLVNSVVPDEKLTEEVLILARKIRNKSRHTVKIGKNAFYKQLDMSLSDAYQFTSEIMIQNMHSIDAKEGIDAFLEKRKADWKTKN